MLLGCRLRRDHSDHAISTDARPAIGQTSDLVDAHIARPLQVGHQNEVVLGTVALGEMQLAHVSHLAHCCLPHCFTQSR